MRHRVVDYGSFCAQQLTRFLHLHRKIPWRLSKFQKARQRRRLRAVDSVVATLHSALSKKGQTLESLERWKAEMPTEQEMLPKDKYTIFDRKEKRYRKGIHSMLNLPLKADFILVSIRHCEPDAAGFRGLFRAPIDKAVNRLLDYERIQGCLEH
jgi:hypothetical protein